MRGSMLGPSLSMARARIGGLVAVFGAVLGGAALCTATAVLAETGLASHLPAGRLAEADLLVHAAQAHPVAEDVDLPYPERAPVPADTAARAAAVPGVAAAVADVAFPAAVHGHTTEGHNWDTAALTVDAAGPAAGGVVVDADTAAATGLAPGDTVTVATGGATGDYTVTGVIDAPGDGLYFDAATALALAAHPGGGADLVAVTLDPGADSEQVAADLETALGLQVAAGDDRGDAASAAGATARGELVALAASLAGTIALLVGFITAGALAVAVAGQRRDLALLRAVGATPRQVRGLIAGQATAVALAALIPGAALGHLMAGGLARVLTAGGIMPADLPLARTPLSAIAAALLLLATVQIAARAAALRASRMSATEAVAASRTEPRRPGRVRLTIGAALLVFAAAQAATPLLARSETAFIAASTATLTAAVGLGMAGPALVKAATGRLRRRLTDRTSAHAWLAVNNSHAYALRTAGAVTVLALAIGLPITQVYGQTTLERTTAAEADAGAAADAVATGPLTTADTADLAARDGIDAAVPTAATTVIHEHPIFDGTEIGQYAVTAYGHGAAHVIDPDITAGDLTDLHGDTIAVSTATARLWKTGVGDRVDLVLADGTPATATVVATYERGFGFGALIPSTDLLAAAGPRLYDRILIDGDPAAAAAWAADRPGITTAADDGAPPARTGIGPDQWLNLIVMGAMSGYVLLGVGNGLVASTTRRRTEFAALRLIGATPPQIRAMVRREAALTAALATACGLAVSALPMALLGLGLLGRPWPQGPLWIIPAVALLATAIAYAATTLPARKALAAPPTRLLAAAD